MKNDGLVYIPLTLVNAGTFAMLLLFAIIGCISVWYLLTRNRCHCSLCKGQYNVVSNIGIAAGGFGKILCVTKTSDGAEKAARKYVLKMVPIEHVTEANSAQLEAKELRNLKHPLIVHYEDDFIHTQWTRVGESIFVCINRPRTSSSPWLLAPCTAYGVAQRGARAALRIITKN